MKRIAPLTFALVIIFIVASQEVGSQFPPKTSQPQTSPPPAQAEQASPFDGDWIGTVTPTGRSPISIRIVIRGNSATQYFRDESGWSPVEPDRIQVLINRNNAAVVWLNSGGIWTETQVFSLSSKSPSRLDVVWTRHVNNMREGGENETWNLMGTGSLTRN